MIQDSLLKHYSYNPDTGAIASLSKGRGKKWKGGSLDRDGYLKIKHKNKMYQAHRLAWFLFYGEWPLHEIDHINGDRTDNRIVNLRDVPCRTNLQNMGIHRNGHFPGVSQVGQKWRASIQIGENQTHLGMFNSQEEAYRAYLAASDSLTGKE